MTESETGSRSGRVGSLFGNDVQPTRIGQALRTRSELRVQP